MRPGPAERILKALLRPGSRPAEPDDSPMGRRERELAHRERVAGCCVVCGSRKKCRCMDCGSCLRSVCECEWANMHDMMPMDCRVAAERVPMRERVRDRKKEKARALATREAIANLASRPQGVTVEELQAELGRNSPQDKAALVRCLSAVARDGKVEKTAQLRGESVIFLWVGRRPVRPSPAPSQTAPRSRSARTMAAAHEAIAATYRAEDGDLSAARTARERMEQLLRELSDA